MQVFLVVHWSVLKLLFVKKLILVLCLVVHWTVLNKKAAERKCSWKVYLPVHRSVVQISYWSHPSRFSFCSLKINIEQTKSAPDTFDQTAVHRQGDISVRKNGIIHHDMQLCGRPPNILQTIGFSLLSWSFSFLVYTLPHLVPFVKGFFKKTFYLCNIHKKRPRSSICGQAGVFYNRKKVCVRAGSNLGKEYKKR